jgi:hydrogenase maturation protein HypF
LEWLGTDVDADGSFPFSLKDGDPLIADTRPLFIALSEEVQRGTSRKQIARRVHSTIAEIISAVCVRLREKFALNKIVLSGGVFMNRTLLVDAHEALDRHGFEVFCHRKVPPNDGGLCLGQLAVAAAQAA